jgi:hypothetical protein
MVNGMGIQRGEMKEVLSWLVCFAGTRDFCFALAALVGPAQNISIPHCPLFLFLCPNRAGSPASGYKVELNIAILVNLSAQAQIL